MKGTRPLDNATKSEKYQKRLAELLLFGIGVCFC